jgi:hypothetical protein
LWCIDSFLLRNPPLRQAPNRYKQAEKKDNDTMKMKFLLHKDKRSGNPPHIQAHLAAPTHGRPLRSQKSLHFAYAPLKDSDLFE